MSFLGRILYALYCDAWCESVHHCIYHHAIAYDYFPESERNVSGKWRIGRQKFNKISRTLTIPPRILQGFGFIKLFVSQGVMGPFTTFEYIVNVLIVAAGAMLVMWIGN